MIELTADQARLVALWRQGFLESIDGVTPARAVRSSADRRADLVHSMTRHLSAVQLDTISVLARSHELVAYSRFGAIGRDAVEAGYWSRARSFEYWSHAACILPMESWPLFEFRRREFRRKGVRWHDVPGKALREVRARLASDGPLTTRDIGGAKKGGVWWDWSDAKIAIEFMLDTGEAVCSRREGWRRVYDLAERVVPSVLFSQDRDDASCLDALVQDAAAGIGVGTVADIADVHRISKSEVVARVERAGLIRVRVRGWNEDAYATDEALRWLDQVPRLRHRTTLVSPFDSLIWHRPRLLRLFGMEHRLEAYTPAAKRVHGYFAMPVLHAGRLVARVDPAREKGRLHARTVTMESVSNAAFSGTAQALREAATWVGADDIVIDRVVPAQARVKLQRALDG